AGKMLMFVEGGRTDVPGGFALAQPNSSGTTSDKIYILYNYRGGVPRVYVDGHGNAQNRETTKLIHTNAAIDPDVRVYPRASDLGWDLTLPAIQTTYNNGERYKGWWAFMNTGSQTLATPWYIGWRDGNWN